MTDDGQTGSQTTLHSHISDNDITYDAQSEMGSNTSLSSLESKNVYESKTPKDGFKGFDRRIFWIMSAVVLAMLAAILIPLLLCWFS